MRGGKKSAAETGKTRPCIVYVKKIKETEVTDIIRASESRKHTKTVRSTTAKVPTKHMQTAKERQREREQELERPRETRTSRRATSVANIEVLPKKLTTPTARSRIIKSDAVTVPRQATIAQGKQLATSPINKRRNTTVTIPIDTTCTPLNKRRDTHRQIESEPSKAKMYKQTKIAVTPVVTPPPTIAASRSRRSIKPNPKYASDDMVTPKYVAALASDHTVKRTTKHLFADDDDDDDLHDLIEEDQDDELTDVAFNPQLHKSDDDDDISDGEFERMLMREKPAPPVKRGRGRPPKNPNAVAAAAQAQAARAGATNLQQLRRTFAANASQARSNMLAGTASSVGNKRKLEDQGDTPIARKRFVTEANARGTPVINGSTSSAKTASISQAKPKIVGASSNTSSGMRLVQATSAAKQRQSANFKVNTPVAATRNIGGGGAVRQAAGSTVKVQKVKTSGAAGATQTSLKSRASDDVPTFTIVNIDDIINQDDVLISRANNNNNNSNNNNNHSNNKKLTPAAARNSNSRTNQMQSTPGATSMNSSSNHLNLNAANKRHKTTITSSSSSSTTATTHRKTPLSVNHGKQQSSQVIVTAQVKPRPRILNAEMGKKTQPMMKPLMSMSKELCPSGDGGDTEDEDMSNDFTNDYINISPAKVQPRVVRRVQTAKWMPTRRNILSASVTSTNSSSNQQRQQQLASGGSGDRRLTKLLAESSDDDVFKKPSSPSTSSTATAATTLQQRRSKENAAAAASAAAAAADELASPNETETEGKHPKYFPPETTTYCEKEGRIVKKITCYETWHVISTPKESPSKTRQQRTCLELPLVKLANVASRIRVPSTKWTSKVTLYKVSPSLMQRQTMTIFTGDLKSYNIPEEERHKYQPSCVLFRRSVLDRSKCRVPFDRAIIFKNKCFYANIEGKHVNLLGAPEIVNTVKDVEILIDIVDSLTLSSNLVEMVTSK